MNNSKTLHSFSCNMFLHLLAAHQDDRCLQPCASLTRYWLHDACLVSCPSGPCNCNVFCSFHLTHRGLPGFVQAVDVHSAPVSQLFRCCGAAWALCIAAKPLVRGNACAQSKGRQCQRSAREHWSAACCDVTCSCCHCLEGRPWCIVSGVLAWRVPRKKPGCCNQLQPMLVGQYRPNGGNMCSF